MKKIFGLIILGSAFLGGIMQVDAAEYREGGSIFSTSKVETFQKRNKQIIDLLDSQNQKKF